VLDLLYQGVELLASIVVHSKNSDAAVQVDVLLLIFASASCPLSRVAVGVTELQRDPGQAWLLVSLYIAYIPLFTLLYTATSLSSHLHTDGEINKMKGLTKALQRYVPHHRPQILDDGRAQPHRPSADHVGHRITSLRELVWPRVSSPPLFGM
jgi:hypothetical protein